MEKLALITGASSGIGRSLAIELSRSGYTVALSARRTEKLQAAARHIQLQGGKAVIVPADLSDVSSVINLVPNACNTLGGNLDLLVNCAGVMPSGRITTNDPGELAKSIHVNLTASILLTQAAIPQMVIPGGKIVFISSQAGQLPLPFCSVYCAAKAGQKSFYQALRYELADSGIHLLIVYPPAVSTEMTACWEIAVKKRYPKLNRFHLHPPELIAKKISRAISKNSDQLNWFDPVEITGRFYSLAPNIVRPGLKLLTPFFEQIFAETCNEE